MEQEGDLALVILDRELIHNLTKLCYRHTTILVVIKYLKDSFDEKVIFALDDLFKVIKIDFCFVSAEVADESVVNLLERVGVDADHSAGLQDEGHQVLQLASRLLLRQDPEELPSDPFSAEYLGEVVERDVLVLAEQVGDGLQQVREVDPEQGELVAGVVVLRPALQPLEVLLLLDAAPPLHVEQLEVELEEGSVPHRRLELGLVIALVLATVPQQNLPGLGEQLLPLVEKC